MTPEKRFKVPRRPPAPKLSISDVAREAGVSPTTVSHVLSGKRPVNEVTAARVRKVVDRVGYVPASLARSLTRGSTSVIGLLVPDISNTFFAQLAKGVEDSAHDLGYSVILCNTEFDSDREDHYLNLIRSRFIDAMIYAAGSPAPKPRLDALLGHFPIALVDEQVDGMESALTAVADHRAGGRLVGKHLRDLGHTKALLLSGPQNLRSASERSAGFREAFSGHVTEVAADFREEAAHTAVAGLLGAGPPQFTCVFAANDLAAFGVIAALRDAGYAVPQDVSVVGFDDIRAASLVHPGLTSVRQPAYDIGRTAAAQLLEYVAAGEIPPASKHILPVSLVVRGTTDKPRL